MTTNPDLGMFALADDMMVQPVSVREDEDLHAALEAMLKSGAREVLVVDEAGKIIGFLDEAEITQVYHATTAEREGEGK